MVEKSLSTGHPASSTPTPRHDNLAFGNISPIKNSEKTSKETGQTVKKSSLAAPAPGTLFTQLPDHTHETTLEDSFLDISMDKDHQEETEMVCHATDVQTESDPINTKGNILLTDDSYYQEDDEYEGDWKEVRSPKRKGKEAYWSGLDHKVTFTDCIQDETKNLA